MVAKRVVEVPVALIVGEIPDVPPPPMGRPEPTDAETIAQLRADLLAERAWTMRLTEYIDEVLDADVPGDEAIAGWERDDDWREYWSRRAEKSLKDDDWWRRAFWKREPIPVMGPPDGPEDPPLPEAGESLPS